MKKILAFCLIIAGLLIFAGCKNFFTPEPDYLKGLTTKEKELILKIVNDFKNKDTSFNGNASIVKYLDLYYSEKQFVPIDDGYARYLIKNYDEKRVTINTAFRNQLRAEGGKGADTKSLWVPTDEIFPFLRKLVTYGSNNNRVTGLKIILGSYPFKPGDQDINTNGSRKNSDSLSGRTTLVFIGTADTTTNLDYNVMRHKEIPKLVTGIGILSDPGGYNNHGTLCPDSCTAN